MSVDSATARDIGALTSIHFSRLREFIEEDFHVREFFVDCPLEEVQEGRIVDGFGVYQLHGLYVSWFATRRSQSYEPC